MEVPGKRNDDVVHLKRHDFFCQPCDGEGQHVRAKGFCQNCQEYLCKNCCTFHRKVTVTKNHVILDEQSMPRNKSTKQQKVICTERCKKHTTEIIKFFCDTHDIVGCSDCITLGHKQCNVDYIPDIAEKYVNNEEHKKLLASIDDLGADVVDEEKSSAEKARKVDISCKEAVGDIKRFRQEINAYLDKKEQELFHKCDSMKKQNAVTTENIYDSLKCVKRELADLKNNIEIKKNNVADWFIAVKQGVSCLKQAEESFIGTKAIKRVEMYMFATNVDWNDIISKRTPIGELTAIKQISEMTSASMESVNVRSASDIIACTISSMVLTPSGDILCTDRGNNSVKVIDTKTHKFSTEITLQSGPWDITAILNTFQYAVTLPTIQKIQFISFNGKLSKLNSIETNGSCRGIAYDNNTLIVSFESCSSAKLGKVEILSLQGNVLKSFDNSFYKKPVFKWPSHVVIDYKQSAIYVSDFVLNSVLKLKTDGTILDTYKDRDLKSPRALNAFADGSVLVCCQNSSCLLSISGDSKKIKTVLRRENGLVNPFAVCFNETTSILYVSNGYDKPENVLVFRMSSM